MIGNRPLISQDNGNVLICHNIYGDDTAFSIESEFMVDELAKRPTVKSRYTFAGLKHSVMEDVIRLEESMKLLFDEAGVPYNKASTVCVQYIRANNDFFVTCQGLERNRELFEDEQALKLDFLRDVFMRQSEITLKYLRRYMGCTAKKYN